MRRNADSRAYHSGALKAGNDVYRLRKSELALRQRASGNVSLSALQMILNALRQQLEHTTYEKRVGEAGVKASEDKDVLERFVDRRNPDEQCQRKKIGSAADNNQPPSVTGRHNQEQDVQS